MKPVLPLTLIFLLFIAACSNNEKTATTVTADGTITETPLPKGRFIIDDATTLTNIPQDPSALNGVNGKDTIAKTNPSKEQQEEAMLRRRYKSLLVFHADDTMKINKSYIATLVLAKDQLYAEVKDAVLETSNAVQKKVVKDTTLEIGNTMKAVLKPMEDGLEKSFEIERFGDEAAIEQTITDRRKKIMWQWKLKPLTKGQQNLVLDITVTQKNGEKVNLPVRKIDVIIFAEPENTMSKVTAFMEKNYQWVLGTLLIPILMGWFNARMRHRFDKKIFAERDKTNSAGFNQHPAAPLQHTAQNAEAIKETGSANTNNPAN